MSSTVAIVVHHRSESVLEGCVRALQAQTVPCEVLVVANTPLAGGLRDRLTLMSVRVIQLEENVGFARACNLGAVSAGGAEFLWFVNPDVTCQPNSLEVLRSRSTASVAVAPAIRTPDGQLETSIKARRYVSAHILIARELMLGRLLRLGSLKPPQYEVSVDIVSGACLLLRSEDFNKVGGFDDGFFLYGEDVDLCLRLWAAGVGIRYVPLACVEHASGTGSGGRAPGDDILRIKGREARRAHSRLLARHVSPSASRRYEACLRIVLPIRLFAAGAAQAHASATRDRAALVWLQDKRRLTRDDS